MKNFENFKQLREAVGMAGKANRPTAKCLRESDEEIVAEQEGLIVYKNGYFICTRGKHSTVFGVNEIEYLDYGEDNLAKPDSHGNRKHIRISGADLDSLPWDYVLSTMGEFRLDHNTEVRDDYHRAGGVDDEESEAKLNAQGKPGVRRQPQVPYYDMVEDLIEQEEKERKLEILAEGMKTLTENEREALNLYYYQNHTEKEAARIMTEKRTDGGKVSQQAFNKTRLRAIAKLKKYFEKAGC